MIYCVLINDQNYCNVNDNRMFRTNDGLKVYLIVVKIEVIVATTVEFDFYHGKFEFRVVEFSLNN